MLVEADKVPGLKKPQKKGISFFTVYRYSMAVVLGMKIISCHRCVESAQLRGMELGFLCVPIRVLEFFTRR